MPIVGGLPQSGFRIDLQRSENNEGGTWLYRGTVTTSLEIMPAELQIDGGGQVTITTNMTDELRERIRLLIRSIWRHAEGEKRPPPRRIQRWRPEP